MALNVAKATGATHLEKVQNALRPMAKADLKNLQKRDGWVLDGRAIALGIALAAVNRPEEERVPFTRKEAAALVGAEENQLAAWIAAAERPQVERFENHPAFASAMAVAKALQRPNVFDVRWAIEPRRTA